MIPQPQKEGGEDSNYRPLNKLIPPHIPDFFGIRENIGNKSDRRKNNQHPDNNSSHNKKEGKEKENSGCQKHKYLNEHKYNQFYVISGVLELIIWRDKKTKDVTVIEAGQSTAISPGFYHKFKGLTKCEAIEIYQVLLIEPDIERRTVGGMDK